MFIFRKTSDENNILGHDELRILAFNVDGRGGALVQCVDDGEAGYPEVMSWEDLEDALCGYEDEEFVKPSYKYKGDKI